ncbi:(2Fe-2S)-binding protein [bacterium]|nr:(2Fe-2S)-binding protein [bacterium]
MKKDITIKLNDEERTTTVEPNDRLVDVIRNNFGIKSVKVGCERGDCGSCTVLLDGKSVRSCLILAVEVDNRRVTTLEGLMKDGLTPLQEAFIKNNSFQCGFCAPGMIIAATELLGKNPKPTREEIKEFLSGNLCRCTGYTPIIDAVVEFVER